MKRTRFIPFILLSTFVLAGCLKFASSRSDDDVISRDMAADTTQVYTNAVHVLVDGRDQGTVPATVRVRRSFGQHEVALWKAGETIRRYDIEINVSAEGSQIRQGFWGTPSEYGQTYDIQNLPQVNDDVYRIPYSPWPIQVVDREYGLTMLIQD